MDPIAYTAILVTVNYLVSKFDSFYLEMIIPEVDKKLLEELESMGFPTARATRALHYSGENVKNAIHFGWPFLIELIPSFC